jgi:hypothetical protein
MKKKTLFVGGLVSGLVLSQTWRSLTKVGLKLGIHAGHKAREFSHQALEDLADIRAEVAEEMKAKAEAPKAPFKRDPEITYEQEQEIN